MRKKSQKADSAKGGSSLAAELLRKHPSATWTLDELFVFAVALIGEALLAAEPNNLYSLLPATLIHRAGKALLLAQKKLSGTGLFPSLAKRYRMPMRIVWAAIRLARRESAKAVATLTLSEAEALRGRHGNVARPDLVEMPDENSIEDDPEARDQVVDQTRHTAWQLEDIDLLFARFDVNPDRLADFRLNFERTEAAVARMRRTIAERPHLSRRLEGGL